MDDLGGTGGDGDDASFSLRGPGREYVRISFTKRLYSPAGDFWDDNWLHTSIRGTIGGFRFDIPEAAVRTDEIEEFRRGVTLVLANHCGEARLSSMEEWIELLVASDGSGRTEVVGSVCDRPGSGNRLSFAILDDVHSQLETLLNGLTAVLARFPVLDAVLEDPGGEDL